MSLASKRLAVLALFAVQCGGALGAQISPAEITNPRLKQPEQAYFHQLIALNRSIARIHTPFPFSLRRYIGLDPKDPLGGDTRGLEFVLFQNQVVLKVTGNYGAAFDGGRLTQNQRARQVFQDVVLPMLRLVPEYFPSSANFDACGFEVAYHVMTRTSSYQYEGKEILTMVLSKADALSYSRIRDDARRQRILDDSEIYLDGDRFGLALQGRDPYPLETLERGPRAESFQNRKENRERPDGGADFTPANPEGSSAESSVAKAASPAAANPGSSLTVRQDFPRELFAAPAPAVASAHLGATSSGPSPETGPKQVDLDALQAKYRRQFDALAREGVEQYHFVNYAPPSLIAYHQQIYLQLTLRNPTPFNRGATSIYKRAAQDFDLFLAPMLKPILGKVPPGESIAGLDITVLNQFGAQAEESSEAVEFICPLPILRQFANAGVTSQDVINHAVVLVNMMRISLDLQRVE